MMKREFESLYGHEVPQSVYDHLERLYMTDESTKEEFVARVKRQRLVESISLMLLSMAEARIARTRSRALREKTLGDADFRSGTDLSSCDLTDSLQRVVCNGTLNIHNRHVMGLQRLISAQAILETLEA